jgi:Protein of unknown function (DUF4446)
MTTTVIAGLIAASIPGIIAIILTVVLWVRVRRLRGAQTVLLPDGSTGNLVDLHATLRRDVLAVDQAIRQLTTQVDDLAESSEREIGKCLRVNGVVRYDAYGDMGGQQSWSIALLDASGTGSVMTCLHARDHARMYVKEVTNGVSEQRLSPEELTAIAMATGNVQDQAV